MGKVLGQIFRIAIIIIGIYLFTFNYHISYFADYALVRIVKSFSNKLECIQCNVYRIAQPNFVCINKVYKGDYFLRILQNTHSYTFCSFRDRIEVVVQPSWNEIN